MPSDRITIPGFFLSVIQDAGLKVNELLQQSGISSNLLTEGELRVSSKQFFALFNMIEVAGVPADFGLCLSAKAATFEFDVASLAALHSKDLMEALETLARYKRLTCPQIIESETDGALTKVYVSWVGGEAQIPSLLIDATFSWLQNLVRIGGSDSIKFAHLELTRRPEQSGLLQQYFKCPVIFNATRDCMVFSTKEMSTSFRTHNRSLLELLVPALETTLQQRIEGETLPEQVKLTLLKRMRGQRLSIEQVAKEMCISARTLQRRLSESGTTFQRLMDEARKETALRLLGSTNLESGEIAFVLGYEELNSFSRAFQSWEGRTPSQWRAEYKRIARRN